MRVRGPISIVPGFISASFGHGTSDGAFCWAITGAVKASATLAHIVQFSADFKIFLQFRRSRLTRPISQLPA